MNKFILRLLVIILFSSCRKEEGIGGNCGIMGTVTVRKYDPTFNILIDTYPATDEDVFIQYGDATGVSDNTSTDYNGIFKFEYLYPGNYTIWVYSKDTTGAVPTYQDIAISQDVTLQRKQHVTDIMFVKSDN